MSYPHQAGKEWLCAWLCVTIIMLGGCSSEAPPPPIPEIEVVEVIERDTEIMQDFVGQTLGSTDIPIRARVEGLIESRNFIEGRAVTQGQLLYTIDDRPFRAKVVEAEGKLAESQTKLAKAKADLERIQPLAEMNAVSQQDLDGAVAQRDAALGALKASEANLELTHIELGYAEIYSPIDGFIGISAAEVGEFVGAAPNPVVLNYVSLTDPIRVRFAINERDYLRLSRELAKRRQELRDGAEQESPPVPVKLILADGSVHDHIGKIVASDAAMNPQTGTFTLEADFPNPDEIVISGQFARVRIPINMIKDAVLVPQRAVAELQGKFRVLVVDQAGTVKMQSVEVGPQVGRMNVITSGVEAGERVAIEGLLSLRDNVIVQPKLVAFDDPAATDNGAGD